MKRAFFVINVAVCAALLSFCGDEAPSTRDDGVDAGRKDAGAAECLTSGDCLIGDCVDGACSHCQETGCAPSKTCNVEGKCVAACTTPGCEEEQPDGGPNPGGCVTRAQCDELKICKDGNCVDPDPSGSCADTDQCPRGQLCRFGSCEYGCESNLDCTGNSAGPRCDSATNKCGPCIDSGDCSGGDVCQSGKCETPGGCTDRSTCGDLACINSKCAPCVNAGNCGAGFDCNSGKCEKQQPAGCTDAQCKQITAGHWCDTATGNCELGCLPGTGGPNSCPAGQTCNTTTHQCSGGGQTGCTVTGCPSGQTCNTGTGQCQGGSTGPVYCNWACGCPSQMRCDCDPSGFEVALCIAGGICECF